MLSWQRSVLAAKIEAVEGTAETLAAADGILALEALWTPQRDILPRDPFRPTLSQMTSVTGKRTGRLTARVEGKGSGTAGTAPELGKLLRACGFGETIVPATSVTYAPASTGLSTITAARYMDGKRSLIAGARGNVRFGGAVGEFVIFDFDFIGVEDTQTDVALISPTYQTTVPRPLLSTGFTLQSYSAICRSFSIDMGNVLVPRQDMSKASGHASVYIGNRRPTANFVVEDKLVSVKDWLAILDAGTEGALNIVVGSVAGNIMTINAPKVRITGITPQEDNGLALLSLDAELNMNAGDDELTIALT